MANILVVRSSSWGVDDGTFNLKPLHVDFSKGSCDRSITLPGFKNAYDDDDNNNKKQQQTVEFQITQTFWSRICCVSNNDLLLPSTLVLSCTLFMIVCKKQEERPMPKRYQTTTALLCSRGNSACSALFCFHRIIRSCLKRHH